MEGNQHPSKIVKRRKDQWVGHCEYILSLFGYLSGSGDFWRFPYLVWRNGGIFIIVHLLAVGICSIPVFYLEVAISQYSGKGMYDVWCISPIFSGMAITMFIINIYLLLIYPTIRLWIMKYIRYSFQSVLPWTTCGNSWNTDACADPVRTMIVVNRTTSHNVTYADGFNFHNISSFRTITTKEVVSPEEEFWKYELLNQSSGIEEIGSINWELCLYNFILRGLVVICVIKSVKSIGKVMYVTTFIPFILLTIVWIRTLTLDGASDGLLYFLKMDISKLYDPQMWIQATFSALNTVAIGTGGTLVVGSHGKFSSGIFKSTICACSLDVFGSVYTTAILFSVIGVMAAEQGQPIAQAISAGTSLGFVGFTKAFSYLPGAQIWSIVFFIGTFIALLDVIVITKEVVVDYVKQSVSFLRDRHKLAVIIVFIVSFLTSLPFVTQAGPYIFQIGEWYYGTWCALITTMLECIICMWIFGGDRTDDIVTSMIGRPMPAILRFSAAFVCPVICIIFFIISAILFRPPMYGDYRYPAGVQGIGYCIGIFPVLPIAIVMAMKLYKTKGTLRQRFSTLLKPSTEWKALENETNDFVKDNRKDENVYGCRTFMNIAYYNLIGRQRKTTVENEMTLKSML